MVSARVAFSKDFLESYSRLPKKVQKKVREFTEKFQADPTQSSINFERLETLDDKVRSVRVGQDYRAIIVHPPRGDVFLCVWVDHHDEAYQWAHKKRFEVNPVVGSFQVFQELPGGELEAVATGSETDWEATGQKLFSAFDDEELLLGGVPEPLLPAVRGLHTEQDLDNLADYLPEEAQEILYLLAAGYSFWDAIEEADRAKEKPAKVDTQDFATALEKPESQRSFTIPKDEQELDEMLAAPLAKWRIFLHPSQRKLVRMRANGPVRVLGGAGTGKTVVLMHRANFLASEELKGKDDRILVTTFTKNLAIDLRTNLKNLCSEEAFERLEVTHLHAWAFNLLKKAGLKRRVVMGEDRSEIFDQAISEAAEDEDFPPSFYQEEWDRVVQPQGVDSKDSYLAARRTGRGTRIGKRQRVQVWKVLGHYRELLEKKNLLEWPDVIREARLYLEKQSLRLPYRAVLADEVQDFSANELRLLRAIAPEGKNTLFLVGDGHQRIYGAPVTLGSCGIEIRGRSKRLKINYRTTETISRRAMAVLKDWTIDDLDGQEDTLKGYRSLRSGVTPQIEIFPKEAQEAEFIRSTLERWLAEKDDEGNPKVTPDAICLAARSNKDITERYQPMLESAGYETVIVKRDPESEAKKPGIRLATMHRLKGLEFSRVMLVGVQDGKMPLPLRDAADEVSEKEHELQERCLFYVAATRARDELVVTGYGKASAFLETATS
ncbi:MAG: UvrD-helicase domain-containing protein [Planctomycetota bacterium]